MSALIAMIALLLAGLFFLFFKTNAWKIPQADFPPPWRVTLIEQVEFYNRLSQDEKQRFKYKVQEFLLNCRITGISTTVDDGDRVLIAASAVIPIFAFPHWRYTNLREVLLYPGAFDEDFRTSGTQGPILGMVGTGYMSGIMILSKIALYQGFANERDCSHTAIHEFIHVVDTADGAADGIPFLLLKRQYAIPWLELARQEMERIKAGSSDIRAYGATNPAEFFSVISEYFFENPQMLKSKHPRIYDTLERVFNQKASLWSRRLSKHKIRRNSPCPCGSGKKFKYCCGS